MKFERLFAVAAGVAFALSATPSASALGVEDYVGSIGLTAATFCPKGTIEPEGQILQIPQYQTLFALFGTTYGGDGTRTFALPDLRESTPKNGIRFCLVVQGVFPARP